ncbi:ABC transporter type 1, transmembrane domain-containing protein [Chytriomyces sp. MP71]|nr:ABC transporter type 1, transmembrane domain-containing protein [Chytriomyces sp. MP71]
MEGFRIPYGYEALACASIASLLASVAVFRRCEAEATRTATYLKWSLGATALAAAASLLLFVLTEKEAANQWDVVTTVVLAVDASLRLSRKSVSLVRAPLAPLLVAAAAAFAAWQQEDRDGPRFLLYCVLTVSAVFDLLLKALYVNHAYNRRMQEEGPLGNTLETPESDAGIISLLFFFWFTPLIIKGSQRPLNAEDLYKLRECDDTEHILARYQTIKKPNRYLLFTLFLVSWKPFAIQMMASVLSSVLSFGNPYFLYRILDWIQSPDTRERPRDARMGWMLICGLFAVNVVNSIVNGQLYFHGRRVGRTMRSILISEIFGKSMRRVAGIAAPKKAAAAVVVEGDQGRDATATADDKKKDAGVEEEAEATLGKIATLMSVDTERFSDFICYLQDPIINLPISITLAFVGLYQVIGLSALAGLAVILLSGPVSTILGTWVNRVQEEYMKSVDKRVAITNETLSGIRIIKYFSWEHEFEQKILAARAVELKNLLKLSFIYIAMHISNFSYSIICFFVTFTVYTLVEGKTLDAATAFSAVLLLEKLTDLLGWAPQLIMWVLKSKVALDRIIEFLKETELERFDADAEDEDATDSLDSPAIGFVEGQFRYFSQEDASARKAAAVAAATRTAEDGGAAYQALAGVNVEGDLVSGPDFVLRDLRVSFMVGGLNIVTGATGSGKSSLILALLGEMKRLGGRAFLPRDSMAEDSSVAYVAQSAWLLNATIRDNILMGAEFDEGRYRQTLEACSLVRDLENFSGGDLTEIGEKGVSISGGQKQRISLARAVYSSATVVLLDDPLSAVDAPTARHLLKDAILTKLKGRTVILVTHAVSLTAPFADHVVIVQNGQVISQGTPTEIANDPNVEDITHQMLAQSISMDDEDSGHVKKDDKKDVVASDEDGTKLVDDEARATGSVSLKIYKTYWDAGGGLLFLFSFLFLNLMQSGANVSTDWWLSKWTSAANVTSNATMPSNFSAFAYSVGPHHASSPMNSLYTLNGGITGIPPVSSPSLFTVNSMVSSIVSATGLTYSETMFYITVYGLLGLTKVLIAVVLNLINVFGAIRASTSLHQSLLSSVLGAPLRFFEITPLGRILNRFSKDISTIDEDVMNSIFYFFHQLVRGVTIVAVISYTAPWFLLSFVPIFYAYMSITKKYLNVSRELKRLQSTSRSPIFSLFSECLAGVTTIRAYGQTGRFSNMNTERINNNHKAFYFLWTANRWLCMRTDLISALVIFCAGAAVISGNVNSGLAALTLLYAGQFSEALLWIVRMHAEMEMSLNSVERCREYMDIEQEPPRIVENYRPKPEWPEKGEIKVDGLCLRYGGEDQPYVLKKVSFSTRPGEKVGVVGRTGAGKSTLSLAFFRIIPFAEGTITIDGMDIGKMGLGDLRSKLTIIPQDPILFTGTIRSNLDPHGECDDEQLWHVLRSTHVLDSSVPDIIVSGTSSATLTPGSSMADLINDSETTVHRTSSTSTLKSTASSSSGMPTITLDSPVTENGGNFSQGQRQLLCMARALLRKSKVIFLDEATASIDAQTDHKIQQTIREELKDATILTIAHRLKTIVDYDRVLVLDSGEVAEFGTPLELINNDTGKGIFRKMCEDSGSLNELIRIAERAEEAKVEGGKFF